MNGFLIILLAINAVGVAGTLIRAIYWNKQITVGTVQQVVLFSLVGFVLAPLIVLAGLVRAADWIWKKKEYTPSGKVKR